MSAETGTAQQIITIPSGTNATLTYFLRVASASAPSTSVLTVSVDGAVVQTVNEPASSDTVYTRFNVDLTAFANGAPRLLSFDYSRPAGTTGADSFMVDDVTLATSCGAPTVTIGGKITTPTGLGLRSATVSLIDEQNLRRTATTSSFGLYSFDNVRVGESYIISISSKRYRFAPRILQFSTSVNNIDFVGLE